MKIERTNKKICTAIIRITVWLLSLAGVITIATSVGISHSARPSTKKNYLQNPGKFSVLFVLKTYMTSSRNLMILISSAFDFDRQCCHVDVWMFLHAVLDCQVSIFHVPFQHLQLQSYISVWYAEVVFMLVICGWNLVRTVFPKKTTKVEKKLTISPESCRFSQKLIKLNTFT